VIHVVHEDTWPFGYYLEVMGQQQATGASSGMQGWLPAVASQPFGSPWVYHATVGVPAVSKLVIAAAGRTITERDADGWHFVEVDSENHVAHWPAVGIGNYESVDDPAQQGFPRVRVHAFSTHFGTIDQFGPETRRVVSFYEGYLPPFPVREVEVFEAPSQFGGYVWIAPFGMVNIQAMLISRGSEGKHMESSTYAHELAHQYFGQLAPPATIEDFWIIESYSELFSCLYLAAAFDAEACLDRMKTQQGHWEEALSPNASLTGAYGSPYQPDIVYEYGPYVLGQMLIRRIGQQAFFSSLDVMLRERAWQPMTTERLQVYLEVASGRELDDFFAFWIHGGRIPKLALEWTSEGGHVSGTVRSDVPFGTFDVPVLVQSGDAVDAAFVTVIDGEGSFSFDAPPAKARVLLDPDGYVLARSRTVRRAP
jgi:aminopeptidase N